MQAREVQQFCRIGKGIHETCVIVDILQNKITQACALGSSGTQDHNTTLQFVLGSAGTQDHTPLPDKSCFCLFPSCGFPTIKYFPRGGGEPEDYNGGRKSKNFVSFLKKKVGRLHPGTWGEHARSVGTWPHPGTWGQRGKNTSFVVRLHLGRRKRRESLCKHEDFCGHECGHEC
eukprot:893965-Pelagomonas_calceolata.AAC.4